MKYPYPRTDLTVRISSDLHKQARHMAIDLNATLQDVATYAILSACDAGHSCKDWENLPGCFK